MPHPMTIRPPKSKLSSWLRIANPKQRERLAELAETSEAYLYSLAGLHRKEIGARLALRIHEASKTLCQESGGTLPVITIEDLAYAGEKSREAD